jgi:hypothetical protein
VGLINPLCGPEGHNEVQLKALANSAFEAESCKDRYNSMFRPPSSSSNRIESDALTPDSNSTATLVKVGVDNFRVLGFDEWSSRIRLRCRPGV